ncbi:MAG: hypothetical protein AB7O97_23380 [Planctomycetota bacterium]
MSDLRCRSVLLPLLLVADAVAQLPVDAVVVLEATPTLIEPYYELVDTFGRGRTRLREQNAFFAITAIADDPADPTQLWFQSGASSLPGTWRSQIEPLATIGQTVWGPWSQTPAQRLAVGDQDVFTLQAGQVERAARAGGAATPLFAAPGAVDLAVRGNLVYAVGFAGGGGTAPLLEFDLVTSTLRTVAQVSGATCVAVSPFGDVLVGTATGQVLRVDPTTGAVLGQTPTGLGTLIAVEATRLGFAIVADGSAVWSELVGPIYASPNPILDIAVTEAETASVVPFGEACSVGTGFRWSTAGLPTLGNATWSLGIQALPSAPALLAIGTSRSSSLLGPLPLPLQPFGFDPDCRLLTSVDLTVFAQLSPAGIGTAALPVPNSPAFAGVEFAAQWFVAGPFNPAGLVPSEGVAFVTR